MEDKILGMFYAGAMGDILGCPYEFYKAYYLTDNSEKIYTRDLSPTPYFLDKKIYIPFQFANIEIEPFSYSDDTSMTIQLLKSLNMNDFSYDEELTVKLYQEWANIPRVPIGTNTKELLKGVTTYKGFISRFNKKFQTKESRKNAQSNGSIMRSTPLMFAKNHEKAIKMDVYLTNPNIINYHCSLIYVKYLRYEIFDEEIDFDRKYNKKVVKYYQYALDGKVVQFKQKKKKWVIYCLYLAIYMYTHANSYEEAVNVFFDKFWKIGKNEVSDTDTLLTVALSLLGAKLGLNKMKKEKSFSSNLEKMKNFDDQISECVDGAINYVVKIRRKDGFAY